MAIYTFPTGNVSSPRSGGFTEIGHATNYDTVRFFGGAQSGKLATVSDPAGGAGTDLAGSINLLIDRFISFGIMQAT